MPRRKASAQKRALQRPTGQESQASAQLPLPSSTCTERNPVGAVQELAQKQLRPLPVCTSESFAEDQQLIRIDHLWDWTGYDAGASKRLSKHKAVVLRRTVCNNKTLQPAPQELPELPGPRPAPPPPQEMPEPQGIVPALQVLSVLPELPRPAPSTPLVRFVQPELRPAETDLRLLHVASAVNHTEQLLELGLERGFKLHFLPWPSGSGVTGQPHKSIVKLTNMPDMEATIVSIGCGATAHESRELACRNALEHLASQKHKESPSNGNRRAKRTVVLTAGATAEECERVSLQYQAMLIVKRLAEMDNKKGRK